MNFVPTGSWFLPVAFVGCSLVILPVALFSPIIALTAIALLFGLAVVLTLGIRRASAALLVVGFFLAPMHAWTLPGISAVTVSDLFLLAAFSVHLPLFIARPLTIPWPFAVGAALFVGAGLAAGLGPQDTTDGYYYFAKVLVVNLIIPVLILWWAPRGRTLIALPAAYMAGTSASLLIGFAQGQSTSMRMSGVTDHPNFLGYTGLVAISMIPFLWGTVSGLARAFVALGGVVTLSAVWLSGSRAALLGVLILVALFPLLKRSIAAATSLALAGIVAVASFDFLAQTRGENALGRLLGDGGVEGSNETRQQTLEAAIQRFTGRPILGYGFEPIAFDAHNVYLIVAVSVGMVGLFGFLLVVGSFLMGLFRAPAPARFLAYPALAFVLVGPVSPNLTDRFVGVALALGLVATAIAKATPEDDHDGTPLAAGRRAASSLGESARASTISTPGWRFSSREESP